MYRALVPICHNSDVNSANHSELVETIQSWARELGFQEVGFTGVDLGDNEAYLQKWLDAGYHGTMEWMRHCVCRLPLYVAPIFGTRTPHHSDPPSEGT